MSAFARQPILVTRRSKKGERVDNIAEMISRAVFTDGEDGVSADLIIHAQEPTLSPEVMMQALGEDAPSYSVFTRIGAYCEDMTPFR